MIGRMMLSGVAVLGLAATAVLGAANEAPAADKLIEDHSLALPWVVGAGILVITLIAGFKHPGRTHLD